MAETKKNYEPFGSEWQKEMMKLPKALIIQMFSKKGKEMDALLDNLEASEGKKDIESSEPQLPLADVSGAVCVHLWSKQEPLFGKSDFKCIDCGITMQQTDH